MMLLSDDAEKKKLLEKLPRFFDLDQYRDFVVLTPEDFMSKHGHYGFPFRNFIEVRFENEPDVLRTICNFLPESVYYLVPVAAANEVFKLPGQDMEAFLYQRKISDFIVADLKVTWLVVYTKHRKVIGMGDYIKKKMRQHINTRFGGAKIMFTTSHK